MTFGTMAGCNAAYTTWVWSQLASWRCVAEKCVSLCGSMTHTFHAFRSSLAQADKKNTPSGILTP